MSKALYRKWRPENFDQVVGQEHITTTLKHQVAMGKPSHAYLFCGSRGTGKTSCSKILAKAVNCINNSDGNPCGECNICVGIDNESILDVTEIDAASNSGVDNIRALREEANFTPVVTKYRVYIIDETHMLSTGAFNALLKIMEEPPAHVIFVLATTEKHKVPATILSRCQRYDFQRIPSEIIADRLAYIASEENLLLSSDAAMLIAKLSDGGMRDAISLLDLAMSTEKEISSDVIRELAGLADTQYLHQIGELALEGDYASILLLLSKLWGNSLDPVQFTGQLLDFYRNLLIARSTPNIGDLISLTGDELEKLTELSKKYSLERIYYSMDTLFSSIDKLSRSTMRRAELESCLLRLARPNLNTSNTALLARLEKLESSLRSGVSAKPMQAEIITNQPSNTTSINEQTPINAAVSPINSQNDSVNIEINDSSNDLSSFSDWDDVLDVLKHNNAALYGTLSTSRAFLKGNVLLVDTGSEIFTNMLKHDDYAKKTIHDAALVITKNEYRIDVYQKEIHHSVPKVNSKMDDLLKSAQDFGVNIEIMD